MDIRTLRETLASLFNCKTVSGPSLSVSEDQGLTINAYSRAHCGLYADRRYVCNEDLHQK